jgi:outer membrane protein OmpA-like peptidoglycan-associated protein
LAAKFTSVLFDGNSAEAAEVVARHSGLRFESAAKLLTLCGPLVLSALGRKVRDSRLDLAGFANMMMTEKDEILRAAPPGISTLLDRFGGIGRETVRPVSTYAEPPRTVVAAEPRRSSMRWMLPALGALAALFVVWSATRRASVDRVAARADSAVTRMSEAAGDVARSTGAAVSSAVTSLGDFVRRPLPNGTVLNVPEHGIESQLIRFIEDGGRPVNDTLWFNFDRLLFDTDAATLQSKSQEQLRNIAEILEAYPNVAMKVGGYTDNTGDPAANLDLSQRRATNVRQALVDLGVPANRLQAEGYGERHPVADNLTEEGRQQNRRIALNVTRSNCRQRQHVGAPDDATCAKSRLTSRANSSGDRRATCHRTMPTIANRRIPRNESGTGRMIATTLASRMIRRASRSTNSSAFSPSSVSSPNSPDRSLGPGWRTRCACQQRTGWRQP